MKIFIAVIILFALAAWLGVFAGHYADRHCHRVIDPIQAQP